MVYIFVSISIVCLIDAWIVKQPIEKRAQLVKPLRKFLRLPWQPRTMQIFAYTCLGLVLLTSVFAYRHVTRPLEVKHSQNRRIAEEIHPDAPRIGIMDERLRPENAKMVGLEPGMGIYVGGVTPKGPAALAGIKRGDIIINLDGQPIESQHYLVEQCKLKSPGDRIKLKIARGRLGKEYRLIESSITYHNVTVRLGQRGNS